LEDGVSKRDGAGSQLSDAQRAGKLRPRKAAEVHRAKGANVATQTGRLVGAFDAVGTDLPAARVPRAEFIGYVDD